MAANGASVRIACLGLSNFLRRYAFPGLSSAYNCDFIGVAGRDGQKIRAALGDQFPGRIYSGYEEALNDPNVDAVYITLPNRLHTEWTIRSVRAGKHVLCEKPLALSSSDINTIQAEANAAGVVVIEGLMYRHHPQWEYVEDLLSTKAIGQVRSVIANYAYLDDTYTGPRFSPALGGGALAMVGSYPIDTAVLAFGSVPSAVTAFSLPASTTGVDGTTSAVLEFDGGHAAITVSTEAYDNQYIRLVGTKGFIEIPLPINAAADSPTVVIVHSADGPAPQRIEFPPTDQFKLQFERFAATIQGREAALIPLTESRCYARVLEAVAHSASSGGGKVMLTREGLS